MKFKEISYRDLVEQHIWWEDLEEDPYKENMTIDDLLIDPYNRDLFAKLIAIDSEAVDKITYLNDADDGTLLDRSSLRNAQFFSVEFTAFARLFVAEGKLPSKKKKKTEVDYERDYSNMRLLIQFMGDIYALYLKDVAFGYIRPLGLFLFEYELSPEADALRYSNPEKFIKDHLLIHIEGDMWDETSGLDLKNEIYDYYHDIPADKKRVNGRDMDPNALLTVKQVAKMLDVSEARVKKMVSDHVLDGYKFVNKLLITNESVNARIEYIEEHGGKLPTRGKAPKKKVRKNHSRFLYGRENDDSIS